MNDTNNHHNEDTVDLNQHFHYIKNIYDQHKASVGTEETSKDTPTSYAWGGELEERRLQLQNTVGGFGHAHLMYHEKLKAEGFNPNIIIELGTGADALLIQHILTVYTSVQQLYVIELDPQKVEKAKATLEKEITDSEMRKKVTFIAGDVAKELPKLPKADLIDMQLLLTHLPIRPPLLWNTEKQGEFPTLQRVLKAIIETLANNGIAVVGDLDTDDFDVNRGPGFDGNKKTQELINDAKRFLKGDDTFRGLLNIGFNDRGAHAFRNVTHLIEVVQKYSDNKLQVVKDKDAIQIVRNQNISNHDDLRAAVIAYIAPTVAFQSEMALSSLKKALAASPNSPKTEQIKQLISKMEPTVAQAWRLGERYVESLQWDEKDHNRKLNDTMAALPSMIHVRFVKKT
ncbi:MAG: hypothetical protein ACREHC_01015 [Candidatus Levyibacteriota bacterium]